MTQIQQLLEARNNCVKTIAAMEKASNEDGADRSGSIASIRRDLASYEKQLKDRGYVDPVPEPAAPESPEPAAPESPELQPTPE